MAHENSSYHKKWWIKTIRERNFFGFRYWWFNWSVWTLACFLLIYGICYQSREEDSSCLNRNNLTRRIYAIDEQMEKCCSCNQENTNREDRNRQDTLVDDRTQNDTTPRPPQKNCRVHFSGLLMGGNYRSNYISEIYKTDSYSEYVGSGFYPDNTKAFPNSVRETFDGIAVDKGTRLIIYSKKNFQGTVLLDITGPAVINNVFHINNPAVNFCNTINFPSHLQTNYSQSVRKWSESNMWEWSYGSCKIICAQ